MRKDFLNKARATLESVKTQLLREISSGLKAGRESGKDDGMDVYDLASEERNREINFILTDRDRGKLQAIEDALQRVEEGTYGICESCEGEITEARLKAMPFTRLCVHCQQEQERRAKLERRFDENRVYRRLATQDLDEEST